MRTRQNRRIITILRGRITRAATGGSIATSPQQNPRMSVSHGIAGIKMSSRSSKHFLPAVPPNPTPANMAPQLPLIAADLCQGYKGRCSDLLVIVGYVPVEPTNASQRQAVHAFYAWVDSLLSRSPARTLPILLLDANGRMGLQGWETAWGTLLQTMMPPPAHGELRHRITMARSCGISCTRIIWQLPAHTLAEGAALLSTVRLAIPRASTMLSFPRGCCSTSPMCECGTAAAIDCVITAPSWWTSTTS